MFRAPSPYALHRVTTDRYVTIAGTDHFGANFNANNFGGSLETGYRFATLWLGVTPYTALQVQSFLTPGYSENVLSGSSAFALSYGSQTTTATRFELGSWFDRTMLLPDRSILALNGRLAWAHDHSTNQSANATFQSLPGASFTVNGATPVANSFLTTAGAEIRLKNGFTLGAKLEAEFASRSQTYQGTASIRYSW